MNDNYSTDQLFFHFFFFFAFFYAQLIKSDKDGKCVLVSVKRAGIGPDGGARRRFEVAGTSYSLTPLSALEQIGDANAAEQGIADEVSGSTTRGSSSGTDGGCSSETESFSQRTLSSAAGGFIQEAML